MTQTPTDPAASDAVTSLTEAILARRDRHMTLNYPRYPVAMVRGEGCTLEDADGKQYLDLFAGFGAGLLGHCHPDLVQAVTEQAQRLWHPGNLFHTEPQTLAAEAIAKHGFGGRSYFCHSGADANESAIKLARLYGREHPGPSGPRSTIISTSRSFHGRSFATMAATGQDAVREGFAPHLPGFIRLAYNDINAIRQSIDDSTVAVIVEPIQGEGGVHVPSDGYLPMLRELCRERDLLLICDEVWTGCGRTGRYFGHQHWLDSDHAPDIMTLAKGVGGGLAVGVMCAHERIAHLFHHKHHNRVVHATTLGGNCLAMAVTAAIFRVLERDGLVARAETLGRHAIEMVREQVLSHPAIKTVRGRGLFIGIELDPEGRDAWFDTGAEVVAAAQRKGVLINSTGSHVLRIAPPLTITEDQLNDGLKAVFAAILG